jgi:hypothetical protein
MDASMVAGWENFYVIIGSAAAGLTGITFVVIALIRDLQRVRPTGLRAFVTPTIVHSQCLGHCLLDDRAPTARTAVRMSYVSSAVG